MQRKETTDDSVRIAESIYTSKMLSNSNIETKLFFRGEDITASLYDIYLKDYDQ